MLPNPGHYWAFFFFFCNFLFFVFPHSFLESQDKGPALYHEQKKARYQGSPAEYRDELLSALTNEPWGAKEVA